MKVRCERDATEFDVDPLAYPNIRELSKHFHSTGDFFIDCPTCHRRYFQRDSEHLADNPAMPSIVTGPEPKAGDFVSDRVLTILSPDDLIEKEAA